MLFATMGQGLLFLWMMAAGAVVTVWYLLCAGLRRLTQAGFWLTLACDLLFGAGAAVILLFFLVSGNYGSVRPFALLGAGLGASICALALVPPLKGMGKVLGNAGRRIMTAISQNRLLKVIFK
ncbi:MAG: spore cortex biosynthesis protein YabQ [Clostridia bacterium]|nr:spore cortex biosynthesis protein YabQ [Clostridia bacterium]